ncbi:hypothetical protein FOZ63_001833 [Perkinsus olseni]|uniref:Uncharacterized protein n=1 Tax=Perkinsus olseni TaxID=32597 RepID=A0A7J6RT82_PEROL|nr:hypothetical protein FOZ63_001833 [Perkinsus olseni]
MADSESSGTRSAEISLPLYITALSLTASIVVFGVNVGISKILYITDEHSAKVGVWNLHLLGFDHHHRGVQHSHLDHRQRIRRDEPEDQVAVDRQKSCLTTNSFFLFTGSAPPLLRSRGARKGSDLLLQDELRGHHADLSSRLLDSDDLLGILDNAHVQLHNGLRRRASQ